jgi:hypothetical protein
VIRVSATWFLPNPWRALARLVVYGVSGGGLAELALLLALFRKATGSKLAANCGQSRPTAILSRRHGSEFLAPAHKYGLGLCRDDLLPVTEENGG